MLQQCHRRNVCVHPDVNVLYVRYIACANNLRPSIGLTYMSIIFHIHYDVISGLVMLLSVWWRHIHDKIDTAWLQTVWSSHVSTINWRGSLMLAQLIEGVHLSPCYHCISTSSLLLDAIAIIVSWKWPGREMTISKAFLFWLCLLLCLLYGSMEGVWFVLKVMVCIAYVNLKPTWYFYCAVFWSSPGCHLRTFTPTWFCWLWVCGLLMTRKTSSLLLWWVCVCVCT